MENIRIVSDGHGTRVYTASGDRIEGIVRVDIQPITSAGHVTAVLTIFGAELDVHARIEHGEESLSC